LMKLCQRATPSQMGKGKRMIILGDAEPRISSSQSIEGHKYSTAHPKPPSQTRKNAQCP